MKIICEYKVTYLMVYIDLDDNVNNFQVDNKNIVKENETNLNSK